MPITFSVIANASRLASQYTNIKNTQDKQHPTFTGKNLELAFVGIPPETPEKTKGIFSELTNNLKDIAKNFFAVNANGGKITQGIKDDGTAWMTRDYTDSPPSEPKSQAEIDADEARGRANFQWESHTREQGQHNQLVINMVNERLNAEEAKDKQP